MNCIEIANEVIVLITSTFMILFTDYVSDPNFRYEAGRVYSYVLLCFIALNLLVIFAKAGVDVFKEKRKE